MQKVELWLNNDDWLRLRALAKQIAILEGRKTVPSVATIAKTIILSSDQLRTTYHD